MKTSARIMVLAENTRQGHRASSHQEFRATVEVNGYEMARGGYVKFGGEHVTRGWKSFAEMVLSGEIMLAEPKAIAELEDIEETETEEMDRYLMSTPAGCDAEASETMPATVEVSYLYATRVPTITLSSMTMVQVLISEDRSDMQAGQCQSGAALDCMGGGVLRVLPESLLPGAEAEEIIQCVPCFEASAAAYARKLHHYNGTEA